MKILRFESIDLYGYLSLKLTFNPDITFLTGINGSGKTSVIRAISALLTPSFQALAHWHYTEILIEVQHQETTHIIRSRRETDAFVVSADSVEDELRILIAPQELIEHPNPNFSVEEFYEEQLSKNASHSVLGLINALPTPMILGIDRRSQGTLESPTMRRRVYRARPRSLDIFRGSMVASLREATTLAEHRYGEIEKKRTRLADKLREQLIVDALKYEYSPNLGKLETPNIQDSYQLKDSLEDAVVTLTGLGIPEDAVRSQLTLFFNKLAEVMDQVPDDFSFENPDHRKARDTVVQWLINKPQFDRIKKILQLVNEHVEQVEDIRKPIENYLSALNSFLNDSGKEVLFSSSARLSVQIDSRRAQPLSALSSGESQLVVILTHLSFSPSARTANVFIVDEPELSLHVKWQEAFVEAVQTANPELQIILATHSPSIILERTEDCVDLSRERE